MLAIVRQTIKNSVHDRTTKAMAQTYSTATFMTASGLTVRTIRDWTKNKLLPRPTGRGRGTRYAERHLAAAHAVRFLRGQGLSLREIRARITGLSEAELTQLVPQASVAADPFAAEEQIASAQQNSVQPAYPAKAIEVVELMDGLSLLVNLEHGGLVKRVAADIYRNYGHRR